MQVLNYSPGQCDDPKLLEELTVGESRRRLIDTIVDAVDAEVGRTSHQHQLITGPRGSGKTHALSLVVHRIRSTPLNQSVLPIPLPEEVVVGHPAGLIIKIIEQLAALLEENDCGLGEKVHEVRRTCQKHLRHLTTEKDDAEALTAAFEMADDIAARADRLLVPIVENFDSVLYSGPRRSRKTAEGPQWNFRRHLMKSKGFMLIAAAPAVMYEVNDPDAPFFDFFREHVIEDLSLDEMVELIRRRLDQEIERGQPDDRIMRRLRTLDADFKAREARLRGVLTLAGGLPRFGHLIFDLVVETDLNTILGTLNRFLDSQTAYFQTWLNPRLVPEGEAEVLDLLACTDGPLTPSEISEGLRAMPVNAVSTNLGRLLDRGRVRVRREEGRKAWYDVGEPLFRVWRRFRTSGTQKERLLLVAEFVAALYEPIELVTERAFLNMTSPGSARVVVLGLALEICHRQTKSSFSINEQSLCNQVMEEAFAGNIKNGPALMEKWIEILKKEGPGLKLAFALGVLSGFKEISGKHLPALQFAEEGQRIAELVGLEPGRAFCIKQKGVVLFSLGDNEAALKALDEAEALFRKIGNDSGLAGCIQSRGTMFFSLGDNDAALKAYDDAAALSRNVGDTFGYAISRFSRGDVLFRLGDYHAALKTCDEAEELFQEVGYDFGRASCFSLRGKMLFRLGDNEAALKAFDEAEALFRKVESDSGLASYLTGKGEAFFIMGDNDAALKAYDEAELLYKKIDEPNGLALCKVAKGLVFCRQKKWSDGFDLMYEGLSGHQRTKNKANILQDAKVITEETSRATASLDEKQVAPLLKRLDAIAPLLAESEALRGAGVRLVESLFSRFPPETFVSLLAILEAQLPSDRKGLLLPARLAGEIGAGRKRESLPDEPEEVRRAVREFLKKIGASEPQRVKKA